MCFINQALTHPNDVVRRSDPKALWTTIKSLITEEELIDTLRQDLNSQLSSLTWSTSYKDTLEALFKLLIKHLALTGEPFLEKTIQDKLKTLMKTLNLSSMQTFTLVNSHFRELRARNPPTTSTSIMG